MYLATTALREFWDTSQEILFLGEWCLLYDKKEELKGISYQVLPYPFDDEQKVKEAYYYCDGVYEKLLPRMADYFNRLHQIDKSLRYWRIVTGEWLWRYIHIVYERSICLKAALEKEPQIQTRLLDEKSYLYSEDNFEFLLNCQLDFFNLQFYSQILRIWGHDFPDQEHQDAVNDRTRKSIKFDQFKGRVKSLLKKVQTATMQNDPDARIHICLPFLNSTLNRRLRNAINENIFIADFEEIPMKWQPDREEREKFRNMKGDDEFEDLCLKMMDVCCPLSFIEGYPSVREKINKHLKSSTKLILSEIGWRFKFETSIYIAEKVEQGTKLISIQHGGGYGLYAYDALLDNEIKVAEKYLSWGWNEENSKIRDLPQAELSSINLNGTDTEKTKFVFVSGLQGRYQIIFHSSPLGPQYKRYIQSQIDFFSSLNEDVRSLFVIRQYYLDWGWSSRKRLEDEISGLNFDKSKRNFLETLNQTALLVSDNNQTTFLQAMALNVPTIIYWDTRLFSIRDSAKDIFEGLKGVKVFHETPQSAAAFVNENCQRVKDWWYSPEVQDVVRDFSYRYARRSEHWEEEWGSFIKETVES